MNKSIARKLILDYIEGWKTKNTELTLSAITDDCGVTESHGPEYHGKESIFNWFTGWNQSNSVETWEITSFYYDDEASAAFIEWNFQCTFNDNDYNFKGASVVRFIENKIFEIKEYRMIQE